MRTVKAAIFDLDGTLNDTLEAIAYCTNKTLAEFGLDSVPIERFKTFVGDGARNQINRVCAYLCVKDEDLINRIYERYLQIFKVDCMYKVHPYDGIPELLKELKERGIKLGVLSNKPDMMTQKTIEDVFGTEVFDRVRGQFDGFPIKPAPDGALALAKDFNAEPYECIYLGDTNTDMKTGKSAGMYTVGVLWGFRDEKELRETHADAIIEHPLQVLKLIDT
ncbi:MAG: HAD family hydrolase [Lachnospiraceae bacterium]|nr:HAD family hydrolase [Lachnospiraceae bacterium]